MNILIIADLVAKSGVGKYIFSLAKELKTKGDNVVVVSETDDLDLAKNCGVKYISMRTATKNPFRLIGNVFRLRKIIKENKIDVIHINHRMSGINIWLYNALFFFDKTPSVWTVHTAPFPGGKLKAWMTYHGKFAIAISEEVAEFCRTDLKIKASEVVKIFNGVDEKKLKRLSEGEICAFKTKYNIPCTPPRGGQIIAVMHGRIDEVKGVDLVVEAVAELPKDLRDKLIVVCSGEKTGDYYHRLLETIRQQNLEENFIFTGWVESNQILSIADVVLQPSRREGFALVAIEAFMMKVPLIRTKVGGYNDMRNFIKAIEKDSAIEIGNALTEFIENPDVYEKQIDEAYAFAMNFCTIDKMTERTRNIYVRAVNK